MPKKIIDRNRFSWEDDDRFRLDYTKVFEDRKHVAGPQGPDIDQVLQEKLKEWNERLENTRRQAFDQGYRQGHDEGVALARRELDQRLDGMAGQFRAAADEWKATMELLKPGLLNLVFDLAEAILEVPVTNGTMRNKLERELHELLQDLEKDSRPVLWVSREDHDMVASLVTEYEGSTGVMVRVGNTCKPGEYQLETSRERIVRDFREILKDFKDSLILPQ